VTSTGKELIDIETANPDSMPSEDEVVSVLKHLREDIDNLQGLIMDEGIALKDLLEILPSLSKPLKHVNIDLTLLPVEEKKVERANFSYDGKLVIYRNDGTLQVINLIENEHRDLLTRVVKDILPKLTKLMENPEHIREPEPIEEMAPIQESKPEIEIIPEPVEVVEQESAKIKTLPRGPKPVEPELAKPKPFQVEEPPMEPERNEPEYIPIPEPVLEEELLVESETLPVEPVVTLVEELKPVKVQQLPKRGAIPLRRLRRKVEKQNEVTRRQMDIIKRVREEKIRELREKADNAEPEWVERNGLRGKFRRFLRKLGL
jgi:hypothetical protein